MLDEALYITVLFLLAKKQAMKHGEIYSIHSFVCQSLKQGATHRPTSQSLHQYELNLSYFVLPTLRNNLNTITRAIYTRRLVRENSRFYIVT